MKLHSILMLIAATTFGQGTPDTFLRLRDTPSSYSGQGGKFVKVNVAANALEFAAGGGGSFSGLYTDLDFTASNLTSIATRNFADLQSKPTTLAGYGITNGVVSNTAITGATKTKITYDTKGLVTAGADATTADIADSTNKRYVTDANLVVIGNTGGTNTGDQSSIVGITGTLAQFNTALTGTDFASGGGTATGTNTGDQTSIVGITGTLAQFNTALTGADFASGGGTATGTNTGDQTTIVGITGTLSEFNTALTGADFSTGGGTATGTNTGDQTITLTGDVTGSGTGSFATTLAAAAKSGTLLNVQVKVAGNTSYAPTAGTKAILIQMVGPGGGGAGANAGGTTNASVGGGGGSGSFLQKYVTFATTAASYTINIPSGGAGGVGVAQGSTAASNTTFACDANCGGGATTFTAFAGAGAPATTAAGTTVLPSNPGAGGAVATNGDVNAKGSPGGVGFRWSGTVFNSGIGGDSYFAGGGDSVSTTAGGVAGGIGAGGSGAASHTNANQTGGAGGSGIIAVWEFR